MLTLNILAKEKSRKALCTSCTCEVTHKGYEGEKLTFCNYGGGLRKLEFEVCECSVYVDSRITKPEKVIGFIQPEGKPKPNFTVIKIA